jgi:hypothetical protein
MGQFGAPKVEAVPILIKFENNMGRVSRNKTAQETCSEK